MRARRLLWGATKFFLKPSKRKLILGGLASAAYCADKKAGTNYIPQAGGYAMHQARMRLHPIFKQQVDSLKQAEVDKYNELVKDYPDVEKIRHFVLSGSESVTDFVVDLVDLNNARKLTPVLHALFLSGGSLPFRVLANTACYFIHSTDTDALAEFLAHANQKVIEDGESIIVDLVIYENEASKKGVVVATLTVGLDGNSLEVNGESGKQLNIDSLQELIADSKVTCQYRR